MLCPYHADSNPSMEVYADGSRHCFVCWAHDGPEAGAVGETRAVKDPENIQASIAYIQSLPKKTIRGLELHSNDKGYFILWPENDFYKFRAFEGDVRYRAPRGHKQPVFYQHPGSKTLVLIEGELNAASVSHIGCDSASPGSAGNFISLSQDLIALAKMYDRCLIWADNDPAGIKAVWAVAPYLDNYKQITTDFDANDLLQESPERLINFLGEVLDEK